MLVRAAEASRQHLAGLSNEGNQLAMALLTATDSAVRRCETTLGPTKNALRASISSCRSLQQFRIHSAASDQDTRRKAWLGFVAGGVCGAGSVALSALCAGLTCLELLACTGKTAAAALATQFAAAASFGSASTDIRGQYHDWKREQLELREQRALERDQRMLEQQQTQQEQEQEHHHYYREEHEHEKVQQDEHEYQEHPPEEPQQEPRDDGTGAGEPAEPDADAGGTAPQPHEDDHEMASPANHRSPERSNLFGLWNRCRGSF